jgi:hypothetical protein
MDVRFEEHSHFQRAALAVAAGGALAGAVFWPAAAAGSAFALVLLPGSRRRRVAAALLCAAAAAFSLWALNGALLGVALAAARADAAQESGAARPSLASAALVAALCAGAAALAAFTLPFLSAALAGLVPAPVATGVAGASFGLWAALTAAPLHIAVGADPVESRLAALRASLAPELRTLADRAAAARRGAAGELPKGARADLRGLLDSLALAALDLASRAADLGRAAPPSLEEDLKVRTLHLSKSAAQAEDRPAQQSYLRAAEALEGQLEHLRRVRRARERAVARLHEEVANLERARFALTLAHGADRDRGAAELDLLHDRLQHRAVACEVEDDLALPRPLEDDRLGT